MVTELSRRDIMKNLGRTAADVVAEQPVDPSSIPAGAMAAGRAWTGLGDIARLAMHGVGH
jgi:hypothetical protein